MCTAHIRGQTPKGSNTGDISTGLFSALLFFCCSSLDWIRLHTNSLSEHTHTYKPIYIYINIFAILSKGFLSAMFTTLYSISHQTRSYAHGSSGAAAPSALTCARYQPVFFGKTINLNMVDFCPSITDGGSISCL